MYGIRQYFGLSGCLSVCLSVQVEGLLEDVDFRLKVTRDELDAMCSDLYDRVQEPVRQALEAADMTMVSGNPLFPRGLSLCRLLLCDLLVFRRVGFSLVMCLHAS